MQKTLKKRCERCGVVREVRARQRRCHARQFGPRSYCCWGRLAVVRPPRKEKRMKTQAPTENAKRRPQDVAAKKLARIEKSIDEKTRAMARIVKRIQALRRQAVYYEKRAAMSDADILVEKAARVERLANKKPKRRAIKLQRVDLTTAANGGTR